MTPKNGLDIALVAENLEFPEGPVATRDGSVILVEIKGKRLVRVSPDGKKEVLVETSGGPNGAAIGPDGAVWIANNGGAITWVKRGGLTVTGPPPPSHKGGMIQRFDLKTGALETVYEACDGNRLLWPNDLVFDRQGGFWFTDHGCSTPLGRNFGALYYATIDGSRISRQRARFMSPNGVGLSPDEKVVYMADSHLGRLWAFDLAEPGQVKPGQLDPGPDFAPGRVVATLPGFQILDSLAVEAGGKICVATIRNGGITIFDPDGSTEHHAFPDYLCTNICFGGDDMRTAWVTASSTGRLYKARWPRPGLKLNFSI